MNVIPLKLSFLLLLSNIVPVIPAKLLCECVFTDIMRVLGNINTMSNILIFILFNFV